MSARRLGRLSVTLMAAGVLVAFSWLIFSLVSGGTLLMNGPWLLAVLLLGGSAAASYAGTAAQWREDARARRETAELIASMEAGRVRR